MEEQFNFHRATIEDLYLKQEKPLKELMKCMLEEYNFRASKGQYGLQFKKWKLRKNMTKDEWKFVLHRVEKRRREGKDSETFFDNSLVPMKKIKKEMARHPLSTFEQGILSVPSPQTPDGIVVHTPLSTALSSSQIFVENLPWNQCLNFLESQGSIIRNLGRSDSGALATEHINQNSFTFPVQQHSKALYSLFCKDTLPLTLTDQRGVIPKILPQLQACFVERRGGQLNEYLGNLLGPSTTLGVWQYLQFALYLGSNNILSAGQVDHVLAWIIDNEHYDLLRKLLKARLPTTQAFADNIFEGVLRTTNADLLQILIDAGSNTPKWTECIRLSLNKNIDRAPINFISLLLDRVVPDYEQARIASRALPACIRHGDANLLKSLMEFGAKPSQQDILLAAKHSARSGDISSIQNLLRPGVLSTEELARYTTAGLRSAIISDDLDAAKLLRKLGAVVDAYNWDVLSSVLKRSSPGMLQLIHEEMGDEGFTALMSAQKQTTAPRDPFEDFGPAIIKRDLKLIHELLKYDLNNSLKNLFLLQAVQLGLIWGVRFLLNAGADPNFFDSTSDTVPLFWAVSNLDTESYEERAEEWTERYESPDFASYEERFEIFRILLAFGADIEMRPTGTFIFDPGTTVLQEAVLVRNIDLVQLLLANGASVNGMPGENEYGEILTVLQMAVHGSYKEPRLEVVEALLQAGADVNAHVCYYAGATALELALKTSNKADDYYKILRVLLKSGAKVNTLPHRLDDGVLDYGVFDEVLGDGVMNAAAQSGDVEVMRLLLNYGGNPILGAWCRTKTPLEVAIDHKHVEMVRLLLSWDDGASTSERCIIYTTLVSAAIRASLHDRDDELVSLLHAAGANINYPAGYSHGTALQEAAAGTNAELVQLLLEKGADVNAPAAVLRDGEKRGRTALQAAAGAVIGNMTIVRMLLDAGAEVNTEAVECGGVTALQGAASQGHVGIAVLLLELGADVNAPAAQKSGRTALEIAAEHGRLEMVQLLLNEGADANKPEEVRYLSAIKYAENEGFPVVASILRSYR